MTSPLQLPTEIIPQARAAIPTTCRHKERENTDCERKPWELDIGGNYNTVCTSMDALASPNTGKSRLRTSSLLEPA